MISTSVVHLVIFTSNVRYLAMDIISARVAPNPSSLRFKIGGAALVFEEGRIWKDHFENLIVRLGAWRTIQLTLLTLDP